MFFVCLFFNRHFFIELGGIIEKGKLYGVGVGPGDKELITLKAIRVLKDADVICVPVTGKGDKVAYDIAKDYINDKKVIEFEMPMSKDFVELTKNYEKIANKIESHINEGRKIAFITLGDPTVYSTYMRINEIILKRGYKTEIVAGVTSFCAAAARLNISLCDRNDPLTIIPSSYNIQSAFDLKGTKVFMKSGSKLKEVIDKIKEKNLLENAKAVECIGMENEKIYNDICEMEDKGNYFSIVIVKENKING